MEGDYRYCIVRLLSSSLSISLMVPSSLSRVVRRSEEARGQREEEEKLTVRDKIAAGLRAKLDFNFTLPQVLESATWKCGRLIAAKKRTNGGPPIEIESDGTIF
jgi:hypothetical protein